MELRQLRYFLAVADSLSFSRAAERLHLAQPTLSHQIKQLEQEINSPLFARVGRRVQLTPSGEMFRHYARRALKEIKSGTDAITEVEGLLQGALTMGVFHSFNSSLLPPILVQFTDAYPGVQVIVRQLATDDMEERLENGELNLGIAYSPPATDKIDAEELLEEALVLVVGDKHPLSERERVHVADLQGHPLMLLTADFPSRRLIDENFSSVGVKPHIALQINAIEPILATVRTSRFATILTARAARTVPGLRCVKLIPAINRSVAIFWRRGGYRSAAARAMADLIRQAYAPDNTSHKRNIGA